MKASEIFTSREMGKFKFHSNLPVYKKRIESTKKHITRLLKEYRNPYVAYSGGKDSVVLLELVTQQKSDVWVRHWDYGRALVPGDVENQILENLKVITPKGKHVIQVREGGHEEGARHAHITKSGFFPELERVTELHKWDLCFMGLRRDESRKRKLRIDDSKNNWLQVEPTRFNSKTSPSCFPLAYWTGMDIWAYIFKEDLPIPSIYKDLSTHQMGLENTRLGTFFDDEFKHMGLSETSGIMMWQEKNKFLGEDK